MEGVKSVIDFFFNSLYNLWLTYMTNAPLYAKITFVVIIIIPLLKKILGNILTHARVTT